MSASLAQHLVLNLEQGNEGRPHDALSDREFQVLRQIGAGKTSTEIAHNLALSVKTVSTYRSRILQKLDATNNSELIRYAIENNLLE